MLQVLQSLAARAPQNSGAFQAVAAASSTGTCLSLIGFPPTFAYLSNTRVAICRRSGAQTRWRAPVLGKEMWLVLNHATRRVPEVTNMMEIRRHFDFGGANMKVITV